MNVKTSKLKEQFDAIYSRDGAGLMRVAQLYGRQDPQDLYQDIALAIWIALKRFRGDSSLRTFAYRIAHNRGISYRARVTHDPLEDEPVAAELVENNVTTEKRKAQLLGAMRLLPEQARQVIALTLEGLTYAEIAEIVGTTENNVGVIINRGKKRLKALISEVENV